MRVMFCLPSDGSAVWDLEAVPRVGDRVEMPNGIEYGVDMVLWTLERARPTDAPVTVFLR